MKTNKTRKRKPANECYLSKDFLILYRIYKHKYKKHNKKTSTYYEVRINFPKFLNKKQKRRNKKSYGKMLVKNMSFTVKDNNSENVKTAISNRIWEDESFRKIVKNEVIDAFESGRKHTVSLLLFSYSFYNEISKNKAFNESVFLSILADVDLSNVMLGEATEFDLFFLASCFTIFNKKVTKKSLQIHLNYILKYAYEKGALKEKIEINLEKDGSDSLAEDRKSRSNRMKALAEKSLPLESETELINWLVKKYRDNNNVYLGVLIKLFTGMSNPEICALRWEDYEEITYTNGKRHHLVISKKMNDNSKELEYFDSDYKHKYRLIPLPSFLDDLLNEQYKKLISFVIEKLRKTIRYELTTKKPYKLVKTLLTAMNIKDILYHDFKEITDDDFYKYYKKEINEEIKKYPIICQNNKNIKEIEKFRMPFTITTLRHCAQKALDKGFDKVENKSKLPNSDKIIDYSKQGNNLFHTNYQFHAISDCGLTLGELNYIIGNSDTDTFSKHYCDFSNDLIQLQLAEKLDRWADAHFKNTEPKIDLAKKMITKSSYQLKPIEAGKNEYAEVTIIISSSDSFSGEIIIENEHGFDGNATLYENS